MYFLQPYWWQEKPIRSAASPTRSPSPAVKGPKLCVREPPDGRCPRKDRKVFFCRIGYSQSKHYDPDERLHVKPGDSSFEKHCASAFFGTHLLVLVCAGIDTRNLTGCTTSGCLNVSIIGAVPNGFRTIVPAEACADRSPELHKAYRWSIGKKYADAVATDSAGKHIGGIEPMTYQNAWAPAW